MQTSALITAFLVAAMFLGGCNVKPVGQKGDGGPLSPGRVSPAGDGSVADGARSDAPISDAPISDAPLVDVPVPEGDMAPPLAPLGTSCTSPAECGSGICVDGVCCDTACGATCEACDRQDRRGTCSPITGLPRGGRPTCGGQGTPCAGSCDGTDGSRCAYPTSDQECAAGKCVAGVATTRSVCNGAGVCLPGSDVSCAPFVCDGAICAGGCGVGRPCAAGSFCEGGRCFPVKASGEACRLPVECASNACVDGRCCTRATCGTCEACTGAGGTCAKLAGVEDPGSCSGDRTCVTGGSCRKKAGVTCGAADECATPGCVSGRCCTVATCGACGTCTGAGGTCVMNTTGARWENLVGAANDIDIGPDGSVWVIGTGAVPGGFGIFRWTGSTWENVPGGATRIGVGPGGVPWVVNSNGNIFRRTGNDWQVMPGAAVDVDIGPEGSVWVIGTDLQPAGGFGIHRFTGTTWEKVEGAAVRITVGPQGVPWVVNDAGNIFRRVATGWEVMPGLAVEIDANAAGTVWVLGRGAVPGGFSPFRWTGTTWMSIDGGATHIAVAPNCLPWVSNSGGAIFRRL
jgi:hypothetical protein